MNAVKNLLNVGALMALWAACVIGLGAVSRVMSWLFCMGYGC